MNCRYNGFSFFIYFTKFYFFTTTNDPLQDICSMFLMFYCYTISDVVKNE